MDAIERWRAALPDESTNETVAGAALFGFGVVAAIVMATQRRRGFLAWAVPGALIAGALALITDVAVDVRRDRMDEAQAIIEQELAALDPLARAQVLRDVGEREIGALLPGVD
jgi:hypothetical protein